ncbi:MAG: aminopeptidase [Salinivirgaceae bacterium]|nr:MAG: aminopeptidase [Salinivirgaceae bacterium]
MKYLIFFATLLFVPFLLTAQDDAEKQGYGFEVVKELPHTSVKNQGNSGTCWSYATTSYLESEILRLGKDTVDLSEMFYVYYAYIKKAEKYIMRHGLANFSQGGQAHDVMNIIRNRGMVPESAYAGKEYKGKYQSHDEVVTLMTAMLESLADLETKMELWPMALQSILDVYFGKTPAIFDWNGKAITPKSFQEEMGINPDDYVEFTSFTYYPYYQKVNLDIPDNWSDDLYYNVTLDELIEIIDYAIENGHTVCWDGDVSEEGFDHRSMIAVMPTKEAMKDDLFKYEISPEKEVSVESREAGFMSQKSTDDHLMHLVGTSKDAKGNKYYIIKNSWDESTNDFGGKLHMSLPYVKAKTIAYMVHKDAVPKHIKKKIGLK